MAETRTALPNEDRMLAAARSGDEGAFAGLVDPYRSELHAHCYRMLGSVHDAEDALQEVLLRAWRALDRFEGRSSLRSWLYTIATNTCLNLIAKRPKRVLPVDYAQATDPNVGPGEPVVESVWIEPYPDELLGVEDGYAAPEARYEQRESVELAFVAALQHLPPNQRAVLILREVLGFSAKEVAETLDTSTASVNSALQRARASVDERTPEQTQQATLRTLGDDGVREIVERYLQAWEQNDIDTVVAMLSDDVSFAMPPLASWFHGRDALRIFLAGWPLSGEYRWRPLPVRANGQPALAYYAWDEDEQAYIPFALNVLTLRGSEISDVVAFVARATERTEPDAYHRWVDHPVLLRLVLLVPLAVRVRPRHGLERAQPLEAVARLRSRHRVEVGRVVRVARAVVARDERIRIDRPRARDLAVRRRRRDHLARRRALLDPAEERREQVERVRPAGVAARAVEHAREHEQARELLRGREPAHLVLQRRVVGDRAVRRDRLVGPALPDDQLAAGLVEGGQVRVRRVPEVEQLARPFERLVVERRLVDVERQRRVGVVGEVLEPAVADRP
jgi:RNA polymerase sigma-70 factor (ECF subfamily)